MLAKMSNLSRSRFLHVFKEQMGTSPLQYQQRFKMEKAKELLSVGSLSVSQVSAMVGFDDPFYFSRAFKNCVGMPRLHFGRHTVRNKKKPEQISSGRGRGYLKIVCVLLPGAFNDGLMVWPL